MTEKEKNASKEKENVEIIPVEQKTPMRFDPEKEIEFAARAAKALKGIIERKPEKVIINGEQYLEFEDWQTIARFFNTTVGTERTEKIVDDEGNLIGYNATAVVYNPQGIKIGSAEASCLRDEKNWKDKPEFQLKSMAQTRACAKALRNIFGWVVVLAGYKTTPAEELNDRNYEAKTFTRKTVKKKVKEKSVEKDEICVDCGMKVTKAEKEYSEKHYPFSPLCRNCQKKYKKKV